MATEVNKNSNTNRSTFFQKIPLLVCWFVGLLILLAIVTGVIWVPKWQASQVIQDLAQDPEKFFEIENRARATLLQGLAAILPGLSGIALSITAFIAIKNLRVAEENRRIAEDKQVTERFVEAVKMLADEERLEVRLGGIYSLKRLSQDSPKDQGMIMEVLASYVRRRSPMKNTQLEKPLGFSNNTQAHVASMKDQVANDVQTALNVIAQRQVENRTLKVDLRGTNLTLADLKDAELAEALFNKSLLNRTCFDGAKLMGASFCWAVLANASFNQADLTGANFSWANLYEADFRGAKGLSTEQIKKARNWQAAKYDLDSELAKQLELPIMSAQEQIRNNMKQT